MLSTILPCHCALQEIPTGLKALGMTNLVVLTKINDHLSSLNHNSRPFARAAVFFRSP